MKADVLERARQATRLTRLGRLQEATALLQQGWAGGAATPSASPPDDDVIDVPCIERSETRGNARDEARAESRTETRVEADARPARPPPSARAHMPRADRASPTDAGTMVSGTYANAAGERNYQLYVPACYNGQPLPLVVMLHGCQQTPTDFAAGTGMNRAAEAQGCFVLYPAQAASANHGRCWNWFRKEDQARGQGEPAILAGMTRQVMARYAVAERRVFAAGLSAGGAMAAVLAVTYPDLFAAVGIHSGLACGSAQDLPSAMAAMQGMPALGTAAPRARRDEHATPTIVFHGDRDHTVHPRNGAEVISQSTHHGARGTHVSTERGQAPGGHAYTKTLHHDRNGRLVLEHWLVHGGGHAWFGGSAAGSYTDPRGPNATQEMLRFFLQTR